MRSVMAPGADRAPDGANSSGIFRPGNGAGGVFAEFMQGQTPKYAFNNGVRADKWRNTLVRLFVRVDASEMDLFRASITDVHTRRNLANRIAGDPRQSSGARTPSSGSQDATVRRNANVHSNGYLAFFIQNAVMPFNEKVQISETLSDNFVLFAFGQSPPIWNFSGFLLNSVQDDQASNMFRLYTQVLRATQMARRQKSMSLSMDSFVLNGVMLNLQLSLSAQNELYMPFSFQMVMKRVFITNFTSGWTPTRAGTPFAADLNAIAYDGRPRELQSLSRIAARIPPGTEEVTPTPQTSADPRTTIAASETSGATPPGATSGLAATPTLAQELADAQRPYVLLPQSPSSTVAPVSTVTNASAPETATALFTPARR